MKKSLVVIFTALMLTKSFGNVKPNSLFSDNMVLQRGVAVPVWGTAKDGETITVEFEKQKVVTTAKDGKWMIKLKPLKAGGPFTMKIIGEDTITINNILVGEVWVCSGQSNMERQLGPRNGQKPIDNWLAEKAAANYPEIRYFLVAHKASDTMVADVKSKWVVCDTTTVVNLSAVGYFFARDLYKQLKVPMGLLFSSVGGTPAENWTTRAALEDNPELKKLAEQYDKAKSDYTALAEKFKKEQVGLQAKWAADTLVALAAHKPFPPKPSAPRNPSGGAGGLYNGMINPLVPYAIKGVIWYQGESNGGRGKQYQTLFPTMITDWRKNWNEGDFPFLYVQIAPFKSADPMIREAQFLTLKKIPNVAMAVITDCGDSADIHPPHKQPVGERLALAARALAYKEKLEYSGPLFENYAIKDNVIELTFTHIGKGLVAKDGELIGFTIAGPDKKFIPATAVISGDKIVVSSPTINYPTAVRYGFNNLAVGNLFNADGLPASPFRTDVE
jgi:sialate O-acetylesterase